MSLLACTGMVEYYDDNFFRVSFREKDEEFWIFCVLSKSVLHSFKVLLDRIAIEVDKLNLFMPIF